MNTGLSLQAPAPAAGVWLEPTALRRHRLFASRDLEETRQRISRVMQPHELRPLGRPQLQADAHMDFMRIGATGLGTIGFGEAMRVDVGHVEDYHLLMFCLRGHATARVGPHTFQASTRQGIVCAPGDSFLLDLSPDCEQFVVRLDRSTVEQHCGQAIRFAPQLDLRDPRLQAWLEQLRLLATSPTMVEMAARSPLVATELERLLVRLLQEGHGWSPAARTEGLGLRGPAPACVRRAEEFIEAHAGEPLCLADIVAAAGVPTRTLLDGFKRFREHSPIQYLRQVRLAWARERLLAAGEGARVSAIALDCGFTHFGRFAQEYHQRFGETPSATLARR
jgi:AraC-like DNA-binding protein